MTDTLRERLHALVHVSDPETWSCGGVTVDCSTFPAVIKPLEDLVVAWLRDRGEEFGNEFGEVSLPWLAIRAADGEV